MVENKENTVFICEECGEETLTIQKYFIYIRGVETTICKTCKKFEDWSDGAYCGREDFHSDS